MKAITKADSTAEQRLQGAPSVKTLRGLKVCDIRGNGWAERFYGEHEIPYLEAKNVAACLRMIDRGRAEVMIQPAAVAYAQLKQTETTNRLHVLPDVYGRMDFTLLLSRNSEFGADFLEKFDRALSEMREDGSLDRLIQRLRQSAGG